MALLGLVTIIHHCYCADRLLCSSPEGASRSHFLGGHMRWMHLCYAVVGFAVARWVFKREPVPVADPVTRFRSSGLL